MVFIKECGYVEVVSDSDEIAEVRVMTNLNAKDKAAREESIAIFGKILLAAGVHTDKLLAVTKKVRSVPVRLSPTALRCSI